MSPWLHRCEMLCLFKGKSVRAGLGRTRRAPTRLSRALRLKIEHQTRALRAGAARRELIPSGSLVGCEEHISMIRNAFEHARETGAANAVLTRARNVDTCCCQRFKDTLVRRNGDDFARRGDLHVEACLCICVQVDQCGTKILAMQALVWPSGRACRI